MVKIAQKSDIPRYRKARCLELGKKWFLIKNNIYDSMKILHNTTANVDAGVNFFHFQVLLQSSRVKRQSLFLVLPKTFPFCLPSIFKFWRRQRSKNRSNSWKTCKKFYGRVIITPGSTFTISIPLWIRGYLVLVVRYVRWRTIFSLLHKA